MKSRKDDEMYINPFVCGVILGAATELIVLVVIALWTNKKK